MLALNALSQKRKTDLGSFETCSTLTDDSDDEMTDPEYTVQSTKATCVLHRWSDKICDLTGLQRGRDLKGAYTMIIRTLYSQDG